MLVASASPQIYFDPEDNYRKGHTISAVMLFVTFLFAFILRTRLARLNKKRAEKLQTLTQEEKDREASNQSGEIPDNDVRYVFQT